MKKSRFIFLKVEKQVENVTSLKVVAHSPRGVLNHQGWGPGKEQGSRLGWEGGIAGGCGTMW